MRPLLLSAGISVNMAGGVCEYKVRGVLGGPKERGPTHAFFSSQFLSGPPKRKLLWAHPTSLPNNNGIIERPSSASRDRTDADPPDEREGSVMPPPPPIRTRRQIIPTLTILLVMISHRPANAADKFSAASADIRPPRKLIWMRSTKTWEN